MRHGSVRRAAGLLLGAILVALPCAASPAGDGPRWETIGRVADVPLDGARAVTGEAAREEALVALPFDVVLGDERWDTMVVGVGAVRLLDGVPSGDEARAVAAWQPRVGPRIEVLGGERLKLGAGARVLVLESAGMIVVRWTGLTRPPARGAATVELVLEPGAITAQYLHVPPGFVAGEVASLVARPDAFLLREAPGHDVVSPLDPAPLPAASGSPPPGCDPETGQWCDDTGPACTTQAGQPGPGGGISTPCSTRVTNLWRFYETDFCLGCPYRFYILVECGRQMHLPTNDMESLDLEITNMVTGVKPDLHCINETALGAGPANSWPRGGCPGKPGPFWSGPLDVTNNAGPGHVSFSDSTPLNGTCTTRFDVPCSELPVSGLAPTVNYGEDQTIDCSIADANGLCGIYRVDIVSGGNGWQLFSNCDGTDTPQFDIFFDCTEAWDAYDPLPELAIANVAASGDCWTYSIAFDVQNIGCVDEPNDVPVRITSQCGDVLDLIVPGPVPAHGTVTYTQPMTLSCPDGTITFTVDPDDAISECTESGSAAACQAEVGVDTLDAQVTCCPIVGAGADKQACAGAPVALFDASSQFADAFLWNDGGAGGTFTPSAAVRNPTYTPPLPSAASITLTLRATVTGSGCFRTDALTLAVNPAPAVDAGPPQETCASQALSLAGASPGIADQFAWSDGGAGGTFVPSAFVLAPTYRNTIAGTHVLTLTGTDVPTGCAGSDTVAVTFHAAPAPDAGVDRQACACEPVPLVDAAGGGATVFAWSDGGAGGQFLPSASVANPTYVSAGPGLVTLTLQATDPATGCAAVDRLDVEILDCPEADAGTDQQACVGESASLFDASGGSATEYHWDDGGAGGTFTPSADALSPAYENPSPGPHVLTLAAVDRSAGAPVLYETDFEGPVGSEWSSSATTLTPRGDRSILGTFGNETVTLTLTGLPAHDQVSICFDAFVLGGWDGHVGAPPAVGPDLLDVRLVGGPVLLHQSFAQAAPSLQSHPEDYQDALGSASPSHPAGAGADETDTLGFAGGDSVWRLTFTLRHSSPTIQLQVTASGLEAGAESWGLDDVQVSAGSCRSCSASDTVTVTVNAPPVVDAGAPKQACAGTPIALSDASGGPSDDHRWSDGGSGGSFSPGSRVLHPSYTNPRAGAYVLTYTGRVGATGCSASDTVEVEVSPAPLVSAGADDTGCAGEAIPLDDAFASSGTTVSWSDGGAGGTFTPSADVLEPSYSHPAAGTYALTLTATRPSTGCTASDVALVTVLATPSAGAGADKASCAGVPVVLGDSSASAATVHWSDGGASGTFSPSADVLHPSYVNGAGTYALTLTVTGAGGCQGTDALQVVVHGNPAVSAGADKEACVAQDVVLGDSTSTADLHAWSDGGAGGTFTPSASVLHPSYRNPSAGPRTLTLTSTSSATGCSSSDAVIVRVRNPPVAAFSAPASACEDTPVCFTNTSSDGVTWAWSFGDPAGSGSAQFQPCTIYSDPGTYTVTLTAGNACGTDPQTHQVVVDPKPVASFTYTTQGGKFCKNKTIEFTDTSTNAPTSWTWDFGDGTTSTAQDPAHSYATDGIFIVRLTACNGCGCGPPRFEALEIAATCSANCEANSNQIDCTGVTADVSGNTCTDHGNFNTSSYPCAPGISYSGENKIYDLNFPSGANFVIRLVETVPEPNGYDLDLFVSDACNPPQCVAWGDDEVFYDDRTAANDDYWLIVDGRDGTCGPYELTVECLSPSQTASCTDPAFDGIVEAADLDECGIPGILLTWDAVTDWGHGRTGAPCTEGHFEIWRAPVSDPADETQVGTAPGVATSFVDVQAVPRRDYRYRVHAVNECCAEPVVTAATDDALDDFGNSIDMDAGAGGTVTCDAPDVQLLGTASGGSGLGFDYLWSPAAGLSDPTAPNPLATIGATYTLTVTDRGDGCTAADSVVVVGDAATPVASAGPDRVLTCSTSVALLQGSASGGNASLGYAYSWTPAGGVSDPTSPAPTTTTPGTYSLTVEAIATGCTATDTVVVTLSQDDPIANAGPNREITCAQPAVILEGSASGGDGSAGYAFSWSPAAAVSDPAAAQPTTIHAGTYTLSVTALATGCTDTDVVVVLPNDEPPQAQAGADRQLDCDAGPVLLQGAAFGGDGSSGYGFAWTPAEGLSDPAASDTTTSVPGTYVLTVTDVATGCTAADSVVVAADPDAPVADAGPDGAITCLSASATLSGAASGGDGSAGWAYAWSPAAQVADPAAAVTTASAPGAYTLRVTSLADGCVGVDVVVIADLDGPPATSAGPDTAITCASPSVVLQGAASGSDGRAGWTYAWSPAGDVSDPASATPTTSTPGTYVLTATDAFTGCSSSDNVVVATDVAAPLASAGPDRLLTCAATSVVLQGSASGGNGTAGHAFAWTPAALVSDPAAAAPATSSAGAFTLVVTDLANGCTSSDVVLVSQDVAAPVANAGPDRVLDCAVGSVALDGSASGGNGSLGYAFAWSPAANVSSPASASTQATAAGTYALTVTDLANGCTHADTVVVTSTGGPTASAGPDDRITCAAPVADLQGSASGGDGSLGYAASWSPAAGVASPNALVTTTTVPGTYALTVTDLATGCRSFDVVIVAGPGPDPIASAGPDGVVTCAGGSLVLEGSASGGDGSQGFTFSWSPAEGLSDPSAAAPTATIPGTYVLTVTDVATGCAAADSVTVEDGQVPPAVSAGSDQRRTCAFPLATLAGSAAGGDGSLGYAYLWSPAAGLSSATVATPQASQAGTWQLTATDVATGCSATDVVVVVDDFAPPVAEAGPGGRITCDAPLAQLQGSAAGGNGSLGHDVAWQPAADVSNPASATPVALAPGTYTLTVTSRANGCSSSDTVVVADGTAPPATSAGPDAALDCDTTIVTLQGSATGGDASAGYAYAWEPADEVSDPAIAAPTTTTPGIYSLTVTAVATGCTSTDSVTVTQDVALPHAGAGPDRRLTCASPTATLAGSASGGNASAGYAYSWSPAAGVASPSSAVTTTTQPGTYTLTVTAVASGCADTDVVVVTQDAATPVADAGPDGLLGCDGSPVTLTGGASGGNGADGHAFAWSPAGAVTAPTSATTQTTVAGTYVLTVTDLANGCSSTDTVVVSSDTATPSASAGTDKRLDCDSPFVPLDGSATGGDGSAGYAYHWEPAALVSNADVAQPTTSTTGTYTLTVTSVASGCSSSDVVVVTRNVVQPTAHAGADRALDCDTTSATLAGSATGGDASAGYAYAWTPAALVSNPSAATTATSTPGTYTLTVTALATGCTDVDTVLVVQDVTAPVADAGAPATLTCAAPVAALEGAASGGNGSLGYAFAWSPAGAVADPSAAATTTSAPGTYALTVTDLANGCTATDAVVVSQDVAAPVASAGPNRVLDCAAASVTLTGGASGGNGSAGYAFHWEPAGAVTLPEAATTEATASGTFVLTVTDLANGCTSSDTAVVTSSLVPPVADAGPADRITCADGVAALQGSASGGDGSLGYAAAWTPAAGVGDPTSLVTTATAPGTYTLVVTDVATGCRSADTVVVADATAPPIVSAGSSPTITCAQPAVTLPGSATGGDGSAGWTWSWTPAGSVSNPASQAPTTSVPGVYTLTATDVATGCSASDAVVVLSDVRVPVADAGPDRALGCAPSVTLLGAASGGAGLAGYAYGWSPAALVSDPAAAQPTTSTVGTYVLTVTDLANGCTATDSVVVAVDATPPVASAGADSTLTCAAPLATLAGSASGGVGTDGYAYAWEPASAVADPTAATTTTATPGTYALTVTDLANGCAAVDQVVVAADLAIPAADAGPDVQTDCAANEATLRGSASGGNGSLGFAYHWEPAGAVTLPDAATTDATATGTFTLTVTSLANGCTDTDTVEVTSTVAPPLANAGPDGLLRCDRAASLSGSASGGDGRLGYTASWTPATGVANPSAFVTTTSVAGTYTLTVTDVYTGCRGADSVVITDDSRTPVADAGPDDAIDCTNLSATLQGSGSGGNGSQGYIFQWTPTAGVADANLAVTTTTVPATYTLTVTDRATGCSAIDTMTVDPVSSPPAASAGPDLILTCRETAVTLLGSAAGGDDSMGRTWRWEPAASVSDPDAAQPTTSAATTFTLTVTDVATGCSDTDTVRTTRDMRSPIADAGPGSPISCARPVAQLFGTGRGGNASLGYDFAWSPTAGVANPAAANTFTLVPAIYTLTVTDRANGCTGTDTVTITDAGAPPVVSAGPDAIIGCGMTGVTLQGSAWGGDGSQGYGVSWSPAGGLSDAGILQPEARRAGTWTLTVTDIASGCVVRDDVTVTVDQVPPVADAGPGSMLTCTRPMVPLAGSATGGNGTAGYAASWTPAAGVVDPASLVTLATAPGTYTLTVTDLANRCTASDTVVITADPLLPRADAGADRSVSCASPVASLTGSVSGGDGSLGFAFAWSPVAGVADPAAAVTTTTVAATYTLTVTDRATGCIVADVVQVAAVPAPAPPEPSALDVRPSATPLLVRPADPAHSQIVVTWEDVAAAEYRLYEGTLPIRGAYDHRPRACGLAVPSHQFAQGAGALYFIGVAAACDGTESSYGRSSRGDERPDGPAASGSGCP